MSSPAAPALGLPLPLILLLALLGAPRVVLHDLHLLTPGTPANLVLALAPPLAWVLVVVVRRTPRPLLALSAVGLAHGVVLLLCHQLLWEQALGGVVPRLGGNLATAPDEVHALLLRSAAAVSSLVTGTVIGVLTGRVAWALQALTGRRGGTRLAAP